MNAQNSAPLEGQSKVDVQRLQAVIDTAKANKTFGVSLKDMSIQEIYALRKMMQELSTIHKDIQENEVKKLIKGGIRSKLERVITGLRNSLDASKKSGAVEAIEMNSVLGDLNDEIFYAVLKKEQKRSEEVSEIGIKVRDELGIWPKSGEYFGILICGGKESIAPSRDNHGTIRVAYTMPDDEAEAFIRQWIREAEKINQKLNVAQEEESGQLSSVDNE